MRALAINCGSSSLRYALFDGERQVARAKIDRVVDHAAAVHEAIDAVEQGGSAPDVVGHRVVHGGHRSEPARVDDALLGELGALVRLSPLHLPAELRAIDAVRARWPRVPQVACFDTAFHRTMPEVARRYALPRALHDDGVQRYGFHGLSYEHVVSVVGARALGRAVVAHLGSGASMAAVRDGKSIDTTMGFTPAGGLVMGTRAGDLDPGLVVHLLDHGHDARSIDRLVNREAGLLALSETTSDVRELLEVRNRDPRAALALDVFAYAARKWAGAMAAALGGIDSLVFTGGVGENAPAVRAEIARGLGHLGVRLDEERNARSSADVVSAEGSPCTVRVVHADEERVVARHAMRVL